MTVHRTHPPTRAMRDNRDVDQLKRQARELLEAHRAQSSDATNTSSTLAWEQDRPLPEGETVRLRRPNLRTVAGLPFVAETRRLVPTQNALGSPRFPLIS